MINIPLNDIFNGDLRQPLKSVLNHKRETYYALCGRDSGKTFSMSRLALISALTNPSGDILIMRNEQAQIRDSVFQSVLDVLHEWGLANDWIKRVRPERLTNKRTGQVIYFKGLDKEGLKGFQPVHKLAFVWFDEFQQISKKENFIMLNTTLAKHEAVDPNGNSYCVKIYTGNPQRERLHWTNVYKSELLETNQMTILETTYKDIERLLPREKLNEINLMKELDYETYRFEFLGEFGLLSNAVYRQYNYQNLIDREKFNSYNYRLQVGVDYGDSDATTFTLSAISKDFGDVRVLATYYHKNGVSQGDKDINDYANDLVKFCKYYGELYRTNINVFIDSASLSFYKVVTNLLNVLNVGGIFISKVNKRKGINKESNIASRIMLTQLLMSTKRLHIQQQCDNLLNALETAQYDNNGVRKDDGTSDIDSLDSFEYSFLNYIDTIYSSVIRKENNANN